MNYTWKDLFSLMNQLRILWCQRKFDNRITLELQYLYKFIKSNLKSCNTVPSLRHKNKILENDINSLFQTILFDFLFEEFALYDDYDKLFHEKKYKQRNSNNGNLLFEYFITGYKNFYYEIEGNEKKLKKLKKLRWYICFDKDNYYEEKKKNINKEIDIFSSTFLSEFHEETENENDSFDEVISKKIYQDFNSNIDNNTDFIEETFENIIINKEIIKKLFTKEDNPIFYIIKLINLTMTLFCKATICHIIASTKNNEKDSSQQIVLEVVKRFNNYVDSCKLINKKCENLNVIVNYLYKDCFESYPNSPKFSIFRLCIKAWFNEMTSVLAGECSLLSLISKNICSSFSSFINEDLFNSLSSFDNLHCKEKNKNQIKNNMKSCFNESPFIKNESFNLNLNSSILMFQSENLGNYDYGNFNYNNNYIFGNENYFQEENFLSPFGTEYEDCNKKYNLLEIALSIINDTFANEYSVNSMNYTSIEVNNIFIDIANNFNDTIEETIKNIIIVNNNCSKIVINKILEFFDSYFFTKRIIPKLKKSIYKSVYTSLKNNYLTYIKNKILEIIPNQLNTKSISSSSSTLCSINNNSSINMINMMDININSKYENEIMNFLLKEISISINNKICIQKIINDLNEREEIFEIMRNINNWYDNHECQIRKRDKKIEKELLNKDYSLSYNQLQRTLYSYTIKCDWDMLKKIKAIEKYHQKINNTNNEYIKMEEENKEVNNNMDVDDFGTMYMGDNDDFDEGDNNDGNNLNNIDIKSSNFFGM